MTPAGDLLVAYRIAVGNSSDGIPTGWTLLYEGRPLSAQPEKTLRARIEAQAAQHEDWCCAKGCAGPGFCEGCDNVCKCFSAVLTALLDEPTEEEGDYINEYGNLITAPRRRGPDESAANRTP